MKIKEVPIGEVKPYIRNPRKKGAVEKVAASLREFGWQQPIVCDGDMVVVVGHTRLAAAKFLGMEVVPVHVADGLTAAQAKAYRVADNRSQELVWDDGLLAIELQELEAEGFDLGVTGFDSAELDGLLAEPGVDDRPEIEFGVELLEEHQYIVLYFDNSLDWITAQEVFGVKTVRAPKDTKTYRRRGKGRVVAGAEVLARLQAVGDE